MEEELKQCFLRLKATLEQVDKMTEVVEEKAWYLSQSSNTKSQHVDAYFLPKKENLLDFVEEHGGDRQRRADKFMVSLQMQRAKG